MKRFIFYLVILLAFLNTQLNAQNARSSNKLVELQKKYNGIWQIEGIGDVMYFNVVKLNVVSQNKLTIEVVKNDTSEKESGGKISVVSFYNGRLIIRIQAGKYWTSKGNILLTYQNEAFLHPGKGALYNGQVTIQRPEEVEVSSTCENSQNQSTNETYRDFLEKYCRNYYGDCYSGRKYVNNSLTVDKVEYREGKVVRVSGKHSYRGSYGRFYDDMEYYVYITFVSDDAIIEFHKKANADFFHSSDYWEECKKTITK